jgi:periplasmic copper chaperone A
VQTRPPRRPARPRTAAALTGAALVIVLALAGCGAGQLSQTAQQTTATGGANGQVGDIAVRDAQLRYDRPVPGGEVYAAGQDAPLQLTIVNEGATQDRLVAVTSPFATAVVILGETRIPGGQVLTAGFAGDPIAAVTLPKATPIEIVLTGLRAPVRAGLTYPVVFTFERAGTLTLPLPVENPEILPPRASEEHGEPGEHGESEPRETGPEVPAEGE